MVEKIWEGTVTVLSIDVVRAISKSNALDAFFTVGLIYPFCHTFP